MNINNYENKIIQDIKNKKNDTLKEFLKEKDYSICNLSFEKLFFEHIDYTHWDFNFIIEYYEITKINDDGFWNNILKYNQSDENKKLDIYEYLMDMKKYNVINQQNCNGLFDDFLHWYDFGLQQIMTKDDFRDNNEKRVLNLLKNIIDKEEIILNSIDFLSMLNRKRVGFMLFPYYLEKRYTNMSSSEQNFIISHLFKIIDIYSDKPMNFTFTKLFLSERVKLEEYKNKITNFILKNRKEKNSIIVLNDYIPFHKTEDKWLFLLKKIKKYTVDFKSSNIKNLLNIAVNNYSINILNFFIENEGIIYKENKNENIIYMILNEKKNHDLMGSQGNFEYINKLSNNNGLDFFYFAVNHLNNEEKNQITYLFNEEWKKEFIEGLQYNHFSHSFITMFNTIEIMYIHNNLDHEESANIKIKKRI